MQDAFDFAGSGVADPERWRLALVAFFGLALPARRRTPFGQLVKSLLSARTRDAVSEAAYDRLVARWPDPSALAAAPPGAVEAVVADVTFADVKAARLHAALQAIVRERSDYDLTFLGDLAIADALAWLERLPGVARKVAASTLNLLTLNRPVFVVDAHVLRVLRRLRYVGRSADARAASEAVTAAMAGWGGDEFLLFHAGTKRLGQELCRYDVPDCARCPLLADCPTGRGRLDETSSRDHR